MPFPEEKSCLISMPLLTCLLDARTLEFFPPAESRLVNSNFPRPSRMQGKCHYDQILETHFFAFSYTIGRF